MKLVEGEGGISELIKQSAGDTWLKKDEMEGKNGGRGEILQKQTLMGKKKTSKV